MPFERDPLDARSFHHSEFPPDRVRAERQSSISVCVPARECAGTIGQIASMLSELRERQVIDQVVVVDAASEDGTAEIAGRAGAEVHQESELMPDYGPANGKGDAMWRALSVLTGDVVIYIDGDSTDEFGPHFVCGLAGPLVCEPGVHFVKAFYRRPFKVGEISIPDGGGRVTELTARPLLEMFYPELAGVRQPLAGEVGARRDLLERVPFATGYAIETALLIDVLEEVGLAGIAQTDMDLRQNHHQPLTDLVPMAYAVLHAVTTRLKRDGRFGGEVPTETILSVFDGERLAPRPVNLVERPPMASLRAAR